MSMYKQPIDVIDYWDANDFHGKVDSIIDDILKVIEASGINAQDAQNIPYFLHERILRCNRAVRGKSPFKICLDREEEVYQELQQKNLLRRPQ